MQQLIHHIIEKIELGLLRVIKIKNEYSMGTYGLESNLISELQSLEEFFTSIGQTQEASQISTLRSYIVTAKNGLNPVTLEKLDINKRKILDASIFHCLSQVSIILEEKLEKNTQILDLARRNLTQVVNSLIESENLTIDRLEKLKSIESIEEYWAVLLVESKQIESIQNNLLLDLHKMDISLLLSNIFENKTIIYAKR